MAAGSVVRTLPCVAVCLAAFGVLPTGAPRLRGGQTIGHRNAYRLIGGGRYLTSGRTRAKGRPIDRIVVAAVDSCCPAASYARSTKSSPAAVRMAFAFSDAIRLTGSRGLEHGGRAAANSRAFAGPVSRVDGCRTGQWLRADRPRSGRRGTCPASHDSQQGRKDVGLLGS